jgi:methyl-accepting chemotaxis protein
MNPLKMIKINTVGTKLLIFTIVFTVILLGGLGIYMVRSNNDFAVSMMNARGESMANFMEKIGLTYISYYNLVALDTFVEQAVKDKDIVFAAYYDDQMNPLTQDIENFKEPEDTSMFLSYDREIKDPDGKHLGHLKLYYSQETLFSNLQKGYLTVIAGVVFTLILFIFGIFAFSRFVVTRPLGRLAKTVENVSSGDLTVKVDINKKDEIGDLGQHVNTMIDSLSKLIGQIKSSSEKITMASTQVATTSEQAARNNESAATSVEEATSTMHEMSVNIQNVAKNTKSQADSVADTSNSIEQMVASIQRIADTAQHLVELSQKSEKAVELGLESVEKSIKGTNEINDSISSSAETITVLGARVSDIGKIVDVIDDIAEQTNLLALNAAIEAARAGEQGFGFAVVAEEVRKLAERSAKSTKEISDLITGIQNESQEAVKHMDKSITIVEKGVQLSKQVGDALKAIEGNVTEVDKFSKEIGAATQEQSEGSTQIAKASENLRELTHEINSAAAEQASSAEQIVNTMEKMREMIHQNASGTAELATSAEQLNSQSESFQQIVGRFMLNGSENGDTDDNTGSLKTGNGGKTAKKVIAESETPMAEVS